jgi:uncharacterized protein
MKKIFCLFLLLTGQFVTYAQDNEVTIKGIPGKMFWENAPVKFKNENNKLIIEAGEKTDMFRDPNATYNTDNAPKLLFLPDSNFVLMASITHSFANKWDGGAIVLKADSANWIKFCYEKDYTGARRVVSVVTKNISDDCNSVALTSNTAHFKVAKAGKVITLYYSSDARTWILVRHFQFESPKPIKAGFLCQSPTGKSCTVTFADIRYEAKKIKDPYTGE